LRGSNFARELGVSLAALAVSLLLVPPAATAAVRISGAATASRAPGCKTAGLVVWLDTTSNGAAGSIYYNLKFTNLSGQPCVLSGYPGVSAVNLGGQQLGSAGSRNAAHPPRAVTLAHGATASTVLRIVEAANFPNSACRRGTAAGIRVFPPDQTAAKLVPFPFGACTRAGPIFLTVQAL
jgi:hypothetical protein